MLGDELGGKFIVELGEAHARRIIISPPPLYPAVQSAGMAELVDAADSKSADRKVVRVRFSLPAPL
jgi:hypothetical protein